MSTAAGERGTTTVADKVVRKIAERAATEALPLQSARAGKATAVVRGRRADVSVSVALPYPTPLPAAVRGLQDHVGDRTRRLTGMDIRAVRVGVTALIPRPAALAPAPGRSAAAESAVELAPSRTPLRWWSPRRLPMALLTLAAAVACGALAFDVVQVHLAHRPAASWRTDALHWLSRHDPGDPAVAFGATGLAALGLLLIVVAVTPGHRRLLTLTSSAPRLRAAMDRTAVAALVRHAVAGTQGISEVKVRVRRRSVTVRARLAFGDRAGAQHQVECAARRTLDSCGLRRGPRLRTRVRPEDAWYPGTESAGAETSRARAVGTEDMMFQGANP
ncbi:Asp23/Gls24 family envelope stress response protein [Streptomyces sp. S3(2020)]|uniref:DUF6286 domain-containing Asp23/Gls24 family envelope stress response protein n=1 Tax=Streptomyces sp. S3(2020) TaxID=2732044 RepID=UPI001489BF7F|nr:DUF6286 domain-containing Asp23/Gls24 family envelope stress response protein [Streptomyces sp. S3(2020)]NNN29676.1 Asp23/Gls24 family envelope stress response protein [Streptomyces sp. S3(2020)]